MVLCQQLKLNAPGCALPACPEETAGSKLSVGPTIDVQTSCVQSSSMENLSLSSWDQWGWERGAGSLHSSTGGAKGFQETQEAD